MEAIKTVQNSTLLFNHKMHVCSTDIQENINVILAEFYICQA